MGDERFMGAAREKGLTGRLGALHERMGKVGIQGLNAR